MVNGIGLRTVIWIAGCTRNCPGCFSPHTHDPHAGVLFDQQAREELFRDCTEDWCDGITLCGGDPLWEGNCTETIALARDFKMHFPAKTLWVYTGFCWNEIIDDPMRKDIIKYADVICDGPFVQSLKSPDIQWVGSSNQHVIDVKKRLASIAEIAKEYI